MSSTRRAWYAAIATLVMAFVFRVVSRTVADPDLWGHVLFGMEHLRTGELARTDPYSYLTASHPWINHEWLAELVFGWLFVTFGSTGLLVAKVLVATLLIGVLYLHLNRSGLDTLRAGVVIILVAVLLTTGLAPVRPQIFTLVFFLFVVLVLVSAERGRHRALWSLPLVFALWVNFHGGVLAGLGVVGIWCASHLVLGLRSHRARLEGTSLPVRTAVALPILCGLATLVNPYGWELPAFLLRTATVPRPEIMEWQPLELWSMNGAFYLAIASLVWAAAIRAPKRGWTPNVPLLVLAGVLTVLPLLALRHLQLFALGTPALLARPLALAWSRRPAAVGAESRPRPAVAVLIGGLAVVVTVSSLPNLRCIQIDPERTMAFPVQATAWLADAGLSGNLLVAFGWGEYAIWHLQPRMRVSMDGRRETVYPDSIYRMYLRFQNGFGEWDSFLEAAPPDAALLPTGRAATNLLLLHPDWETLHSDSTATLIARREAGAGQALRATPFPDRLPPDGRGLCFP